LSKSSIEVFDPEDDQPKALAAPAPFNPAALLQQMATQGFTPEMAGAVEKLAQVAMQQEDRHAKAEFNRAFIKLKRDLKPIAVQNAIPLKGGGVKSKFASWTDIKDQIDPLLERHGFTDTYSQEPADSGKTKVICTLVHEGGHERSAEFTCREHASPNNTQAQNDGGTSTLAKRYALCLILGLTFDYSDARAEGDTITEREAADIERRVGNVCGGDTAQIARYLKMTGAPSWERVTRAKYEVVLSELEREEHDAAQYERPAPVAAAPAKEQNAPDFTSAGDWKDAMEIEMGRRWGCTPAEAATQFKKLIAASQVSSFLAVPEDRRLAAWQALTSGRLDRAYRPKGTA